MWKKIVPIIVFILFGLAAALIQFSFIFTLPSFFSSLNLVVIILIFTLFFWDFRSAIWAAAIIGFWLDLFSFNFFGLYLWTLFLTAVLSHWILNAWLTNRSLYSFLLLILIATAAYNLLVGGFFYFSAYDARTFFLGSANFWLDVGYQAAWSILAALLMFNLAGLATKRLQPFFLEKK